MTTYLHTLHTVWMYWSDEDALELHGALDDNTVGENYEAYAEMVEAARSKVGPQNVREIQIEIDWMEICRVFERPKIEGTVKNS